MRDRGTEDLFRNSGARAVDSRLCIQTGVVVLLCTAAACAPRVVRSTPEPPTKAELAQLWVEPANISSRDLLRGPGGDLAVPAEGYTFRFKGEKTTGYSPGFTVEDAEGIEWSAKQGPEAQTEVVASRLYWAVGYRQPPTYHLVNWYLEGGGRSGPQRHARFRPDIGKVTGEWSLHENPFVGTQPYRGLLVLHVVLNNWDIKTAQNKIYEFEQPRGGARRWFVVRDVGATFGRPRWPAGSRNNPDHYEKHPFILDVEGERVRFPYQGRHDELLKQITRRDVRWTSERLAQITDTQLGDAFRAAHYDDVLAARFIRRLKEKIADGLNVCARGC